jgi:4-amino-4-deoxy-L-arabinose transferase-like glycosyltransferase
LLPQVEPNSSEEKSVSDKEGSGALNGSRASAVILLIALSAAIYLGNAGFPALLDDADASHAMVSHEMLQRHDWVILYMNGIRYLMKAPLHYWAVAMSYAALGQSEFSTRLPVALAMIGLVLLVNEFARRFFGARAGLYSGLVVCTSAGLFLFTRIMIPEAIYALEFTGIFYLLLRGWTGSLEPRVAYWGAAALTGLAMLTRGLIGVVFPVAILFLFIVATRSWRRWRELHLFSSAGIFLLVAAPWHILSSLRADSFFWSYFINEHLKRAIGTRYPPDYEAVPLWLWLGAHLIWFFPWSIFIPGVLSCIPRPRTWKNLPAEGQAAPGRPSRCCWESGSLRQKNRARGGSCACKQHWRQQAQCSPPRLLRCYGFRRKCRCTAIFLHC